MNYLRLFLLLLDIALTTINTLAQTLPTAPNRRTTQGARTGDWVLYYTKTSVETTLPDSITYYRKVTFDATGKPTGKIRDYYRSGALKFEGVMLQMEPKEVKEGLCVWYDEKGDSTKSYYENGQRFEWKTLNQEVVKLYQAGNYAQAISVAEKSKEIAWLTLGDTHPDYATSLDNLATLYKSKGQYAKAEPLFEQALAIRKKSLDESHPSYAATLDNLDVLYSSQGQYAKAEPFYEQALAIRKKTLGESHPDYAQSLNNLAELYHRQGQYAKAEPLFLQSLQIERKNLITFFEIANETQQKAYISKKKYLFELENSCGLLSKNGKTANSAYQSALLIKGLQLQTLTQLLEHLRQSKDTLLQAQYTQYQAWHQQLNQTHTPPPIAARLRVQADSLYQHMARRSATVRNFRAAFEVTPQAIQKKLLANEVAIEFVHFQYHNGQRWTDSTYYAALVLRPDWPNPRMIYLCEQRALYSLFQAALGRNEERRQYYVERLYDTSTRGPEVISIKAKPLRNLYTLLWQPLDSLLAGVTAVYYAPTGLLHRLNLSAIVTPAEGQTLLDKYPRLISLRSTRELVLSPSSPSAYSNTALLVGGIQYQLDSALYQKANADFIAHRSPASDSLLRGGSFSNLRYSDKEMIDTYRALIAAGFKADTLRGFRASEEGFHYFIGSQKPRVILLATHGFFNEDTLSRRRRNKDLPMEGEPIFVTSGNPMLRSGLVLAGGNQAWLNQAVPVNQADGILTAAEISSTKLDQTELVILSACDTGLGDLRGSEGVFGLQRAFKIAGAKYLMMTLWQVQDDIPPRFMSLFYEYWLADPHRNIRKAFDETVRQFRKTYASPYYWAAFVLIE